MADAPPGTGDDRPEDTSKLELPSLKLPGLGRRNRRTPPETPPEDLPQAEHGARHRPPAHANGAGPSLEPARVPAPEPETASTPERAEELAGESGQRRAPRRVRTLPTLPGWAAALVTGVVVGVAGALLTYLSQRGCEAVRGTSSCGGTGVLLLVVILGLMVLLGGVLLALLHVTDPRPTSLLAVGVLCVVVLLTPQDRLFSVWSFLLVPVVGAAAYVLAHWVTTRFVEPQPEQGPAHDVR